MSKRWDKDEKARLIHLFAEGKSYNEIAEKLDRSESAIRLRLQSIVYDGIAKGLRAADLQDTLKTDIENIAQMFYTHRDFKESRGEEVISLEAASKLLFSSRRSAKKTKTVDELIDVPDQSGINKPLSNKSASKSASSSSTRSDRLDRLVDQNRIMEAIIKNRDLRKQIKRIYKGGKLSKEEQALLENILSQ